jgi:L-2,4-diaminobutyrate decarboxylase
VDIEKLKSTTNEIISQGEKIMAIVGCACSTATGSYDDIAALTSICQEKGIWLHIDGAHGGAAIFSERLKKKLFSGVHLADSIIIDAHKMMLTPALATAVLFKNHVDGYNSFKQKADYLFNESDIDPHNLAKRTYETTKYMMSIKVYYLLKKYGVEYIGEFVERQTNLAIWYYKQLTEATDFECAHKPQTNILCFRYVDQSISELNELNQFIRQQLLNEGSFYIVSTVLRGNYYLRVSIMNPATTEHHLINLVSKIRSIAATYPNR